MTLAAYFEDTFPEWEAVYHRRTVYATIYQERLAAALRCVDELGLEAGAPAVDLGCGPGRGAIALARRGLKVHAVDASRRMVDKTLQRARSEGVEALVEGSVSEVQTLALPDAAFELAFVVGVSEWIEAIDRPLAEIARVLRPGGALVMTADNSWALSSLLDPLQNPLVVPLKQALGRALGRLWPRRRPTRLHPRSRRAIEEALRHAGLMPSAARTLGFGPFTLFNQELLPDALGRTLHWRLEALAGRPLPWLRSAGLVHVLVARKLTPASAPG
jgi:ubiquinone/menaquinone biosynthesis C-methylase UbiE